MSIVHRRQLLASLLATPISACTASNLLAAAGLLSKPGLQVDSDLSPGVVIAWEASTGSESLIDLWTARVGDVDLSALPPCVQRVVVWDDVFSHNSLHQTIGRILEAIPKYYGFDCRAEPNGSSFHLVDRI